MLTTRLHLASTLGLVPSFSCWSRYHHASNRDLPGDQGEPILGSKRRFKLSFYLLLSEDLNNQEYLRYSDRHLPSCFSIVLHDTKPTAMLSVSTPYLAVRISLQTVACLCNSQNCHSTGTHVIRSPDQLAGIIARTTSDLRSCTQPRGSVVAV